MFVNVGSEARECICTEYAYSRASRRIDSRPANPSAFALRGLLPW